MTRSWTNSCFTSFKRASPGMNWVAWKYSSPRWHQSGRRRFQSETAVAVIVLFVRLLNWSITVKNSIAFPAKKLTCSCSWSSNAKRRCPLFPYIEEAGFLKAWGQSYLCTNDCGFRGVKNFVAVDMNAVLVFWLLFRFGFFWWRCSAGWTHWFLTGIIRPKILVCKRFILSLTVNGFCWIFWKEIEDKIKNNVLVKIHPWSVVTVVWPETLEESLHCSRSKNVPVYFLHHVNDN